MWYNWSINTKIKIKTKYMNENRNENTNEFDVLGEIDVLNYETQYEEAKVESFTEHFDLVNLFSEKEESNHDEKKEILEAIIEKHQEEEKLENTNAMKKVIETLVFWVKYITTSVLIFAVLLVSTNYSAYINIAKSYIFEEELKQNGEKLISAVEASNFIEKEQEKVETVEDSKKSQHSLKTLLAESNKTDSAFDVEITPYENKVVIPKIGKNIPLLDIKPTVVSGQDELNNIFMQELEKGIIRYPGSVKPGNDGNTFIFGHSSNFPWIKGDYNDVFALLDKVVYDDYVYVYYDQKKYTYKIREKKVVRPGDVSVLKRNKGKNEITLMTCRPIGTTLNRLLVVWELVEE